MLIKLYQKPQIINLPCTILALDGIILTFRKDSQEKLIILSKR